MIYRIAETLLLEMEEVDDVIYEEGIDDSFCIMIKGDRYKVAVEKLS